MQLRRKKLALLISLIGAGVSPYAYARGDLRVAGAPESPLNIALDDSATWAEAPAWHSPDGTLELVNLPDDLQESMQLPPSSVQASDDAPEAAHQTPEEFSDAAPGEVTRETRASMPARESVSRKIVAPAPIKTSAAQPVESAPTTHADRLLESLAAVLLEDVSALGIDATVPSFAEHAPAPSLAAAQAAHEPPMWRAPATDPVALRVEQREIVVAPPAERVLRDLEFVLTGDKVVVEQAADKVLSDLQFVLTRDKVRLGSNGTAPTQETIVATHADKVLATLEDISSARHASENPAGRRARKFAAAQAWSDAAAADELPRATPIVLAARAAMQIDIDLTQPMPVEHVAAPVTPIDDVAAPLAMEPGPMQWYAGAPIVPIVPASNYIEPSETHTPRPSPFGSKKVAINEKSLDRIRGGFFGDGLNVSFGIERAVYINGTLVTTTSLNVSDLGRVTAGRGTASFDSGTLALIQSGAGNTVTSGTFSSTSIGTVVQNTLNGQKIQSVTVINATANSLGVLRGLNLQQSMRSAVNDSLRR